MEPNDQWTLKGGVSTGYKFQQPNDLHNGINGFSSQGRNVTLGNPDLKPRNNKRTWFCVTDDLISL